MAKRAPKLFLCFEKLVQSRPNRPLLTKDIITSSSWKSTGIMKLMLAEYHLAASVVGLVLFSLTRCHSAMAY